ncbi:hypothetical protein K2X40_01720 [Candidatus Babeliales bacterium]|nr:hypothetical protein [Candidatus Babeliales bacterium]
MIKKSYPAAIFLLFAFFCPFLRSATGELLSDFKRIVATQRIKMCINLPLPDQVVYYDSLSFSLDYEGVVLKGFKVASEPVVRHIAALRADKKVLQGPLNVTLRFTFSSSTKRLGSGFKKAKLYVSLLSLDRQGRHKFNYLVLPLAGQLPAGSQNQSLAAERHEWGGPPADSVGLAEVPEEELFFLDPFARVLAQVRYALGDFLKDYWFWVIYCLMVLVVVGISLGLWFATTTQYSIFWLRELRLVALVCCIILSMKFAPRSLFFVFEATTFLLLGLFFLRPSSKLPVLWSAVRTGVGACLLMGVFPLLVKALLVYGRF